MNYIKFFFSTILVFSTFFTAFAQDIIHFKTQAEADAFDKSITTIKGDLVISDVYSTSAPIKNLDGLSQLTTVEGDLRIDYNRSLTNLDGLSQLMTVGGNLHITRNALLTNVDGLSQLTTVGGDLMVGGEFLTNLDGLSQLTTVGGGLGIVETTSLTNLDGLSQLTTVGGDLMIEENISLNNCCGIRSLLSKAGAIKGEITIEKNASPCNSKAAILSVTCDSPDEGEEVAESDYKKNLYQLTRWELKDCSSIMNYKFAKEDTYTLNGKNGGSYNVAGKTLTITPKGGTAKTYTITKMTRNAMHLNDASGTETVYGRKQHFSTEKLTGTNWKEKGGANGGMRMKFLDATNIEIITIGSKGSKIRGTYTVDSSTKKLTISLDASQAAAQGFSSTLNYDVATFNFMMMKLNGGDGETCFNRTR